MFRRSANLFLRTKKSQYRIPLYGDLLRSSKVFADCILTPNHVIHNPKCHFSYNDKQNDETFNKDKENAAAVKQEKSSNELPLLIREDFLEYISNKSSEPIADYTYKNKNIYECFDKSGYLNNLEFIKKSQVVFWCGVTYLISSINPWVTIIPIGLLGYSLLGLGFTMKLQKDMIQKIELIDSSIIKIYPLSMKSQGILCEIKDIELVTANRVPKSKWLEGYSITVDFKESKTLKEHKGMVLFVDPRSTKIENMDLFKTILHADVDQIAKFKFNEDRKE